MKIAILYICTGRYDLFWKDFFLSAEKFFLPGTSKEYYVFTDAEKLYAEDEECIHKLYQENLGWPGNTLFRFKFFRSIIDELRCFDYVFFMNANTLFKAVVEENILPDDGLIVVKHCEFWFSDNTQFPYDRNESSLAFIPMGYGDIYVTGAINGGKADAFIQMIIELDAAIDDDYSRGIIALWHDESHLNKYILSHKYTALDSSYAQAENKYSPCGCKILLRDKRNYGEYSYLRGITNRQGEEHLRHTFVGVDSIIGKNIIIYGAGNVGYSIYTQLERNNVNIVAWVDKNYQIFNYKSRTVESVNVIGARRFDYIVVAIKNRNIAESVRFDLCKRFGISMDCILWNIKCDNAI